MTESMTCPSCQGQIGVAGVQAGQFIFCPHCQATISIMASTASPAFATQGIPGIPPPPPSPPAQSNYLMLILIVAGGFFVFCLISMFAIAFVGEQVSTTFSTIGTPIR